MNLEELRARLGPTRPPVFSFSDGTTEIASLEQSVGGRIFTGPSGEYFAVDYERTVSDLHGRYSFGSLQSINTLRLPVVSGQLQVAEVATRSIAFIDTETTGLGYGVGTHVFIVGIGHITDGGFHVRQFFLRHPGEEHAVLAAISEYLAPFSTLVSYNGRSFDWPLLENRFIYQRLWSDPLEPTHIDLLYTARRVWKRRLDSCGLASVERQILAVNRTAEDIEGWLIPQIYFGYLRTGNAGPLRRVFYHNAHDICSLAMLTQHLHHVLRDPWAGVLEDPIDFMCLSRIYDLVGESDTAVRCLSHALESGLPPRLETEAWLRLALINKRKGAWGEALPFFQRVIERHGFERIGCIELAKYHEHVARDHSLAMKYTVRAMRSSDYPEFVRWPGTQRIELHNRHRRLQRRLSSQVA